MQNALWQMRKRVVYPLKIHYFQQAKFCETLSYAPD
jgi:hypothetical protein